MFKKSLLAAALLIAGGTAVNAAEIGVRSSYGTSFRNITNGRFVSAGASAEAYVENSAGFSLGLEQVSTETREGSIDRVVGEPVTLTEERDLTASFFGNEFPTGETATTTTEVLGDVSETSDFEATSRDFNGVSGSGYTRTLVGARADGYKESYHFSGGSSQTFSELSTFSR